MVLYCFVITGKTRTKDKYRVVYTDHQRLELEKEFHYSRYITIRRKAELAQNLSLSERQVKIWFQNRRAKERKQNKKREDGMKGGADMSGLGQGGMVSPAMSNSIQGQSQLTTGVATNQHTHHDSHNPRTPGTPGSQSSSGLSPPLSANQLPCAPVVISPRSSQLPPTSVVQTHT